MPEPLTARMSPTEYEEMPVPPDDVASAVESVSAPAASKDEVAVAPKYAGPYEEKSVVEARENCWRAVHEFALARLSEATTAPVVGEIVNVPSAFETDVTAPLPRQLPLIEKQPPAISMPRANVEVADVPVTLR